MAVRRPVVFINGRYTELPAVDTLPPGAAPLHIGTTAPADPVAFPFWWNTDAGAFLVYVGSGTWVEPGGVAAPYVSDTAPDPDIYPHWFTLAGEHFVWDGADWFQVVGSSEAGVDWNNVTGKPATFPPSTHSHVIADVTGLQTALDGKQATLGFTPENTTQKGAAGGYAALDGTGRVPSSQLPSFVDDVLEFANFAALPGTGEAGKIYITLDNNQQYRWGGSAYVQIPASPGTTDAVPEGTTNLYHTVARVRATVLAGLSTATNAVITAADTVLSALGKLQRQISDHFGAGGTAHADATTAVSGFMSGTDKTKLNGVATGATAVTTADIRAQIEAALIQGTNVTLTAAGAGATRTITIAATGGGADTIFVGDSPTPSTSTYKLWITSDLSVYASIDNAWAQIGGDGVDGREVELQVSSQLLQWRYVGGASWITLFDLSTLGGGGGGSSPIISWVI